MNSNNNVLINNMFYNPLTIIVYLFIFLLQYCSPYISFNYSDVIRDFTGIILQVLFTLTGVIMVYYGLLNKVSIKNFIDLLLSIQKDQSLSLLQTRQSYDNYEKLYSDLNNQFLIHISKIYNIILFLCVIDLIIYMAASKISTPYQILILCITIYVFKEIVKITNKVYLSKTKDCHYLPHPTQLLNISKPLTSIQIIDIALDEEIPIVLLRKGSYIKLADKIDLMYLAECHIDIDEQYNTFIIIYCALNYNFENVFLSYNTENNSEEKIDLSKAEYNYFAKNPSIIIALPDNKKPNNTPNFKLEIKDYYPNMHMNISYKQDSQSEKKYIMLTRILSYNIKLGESIEPKYILYHK